MAEKAIRELEDEILRSVPGGGPITGLNLIIAASHLNARIRNRGLSSREMWTQRDQFTHKQLPICDRDLITEQFELRSKNHPHSEKSKNKSKPSYDSVHVGDLVYLRSDRSKLHARSRYLVVSMDGEWCIIKKFVGDQLRATSYKVKEAECYSVPSTVGSSDLQDHCSDDEIEPVMAIPDIQPPPIPEPPEILVLEPDSSEYPSSDTPNTLELLSTPSTDYGTDAQSHTVDVSDTLQCPRPQRSRRRPTYLDNYITQ